ncbi:hypothetical protein P8452_58026 [Trifolium repens]|nr:hypothetical protein P8452_58026 [Trifolium repens]
MGTCFCLLKGSVSLFDDKGLQAEFPPNTNILYVDLPSAELVGSNKNVNSIPEMVLNTRKPIVYVDQFGRHYCAFQPLLRLFIGNSAFNLNEETDFAPFEITTLIIESLTCS